MSHSTNARTNIQQIHPKIYYKQYLHDADEPRDVISRGVSKQFESDMTENSYQMKLQFRHLAQRLRNQH